MQPLLLLKQTLEASYDPGPLLLNGPKVRFTSADQLLSRTGSKADSDELFMGIEAVLTQETFSRRPLFPNEDLGLFFSRQPGQGLAIDRMTFF